MKIDLTPDGARLENEHVRLELARDGDCLVERIAAFDGDAWVPVLSTAAASTPPDLVPEADTVAIVEDGPERVALRLEGRRDGHRFTVEIALERPARSLQIRVQDRIEGAARVRSLLSRYSFAAPEVDFCFAPHLRPDPDHVVGQFAFKSPAVIVQRGTKLAALLPDLELIGREAPMLVALEPNVAPESPDGPGFAYGFKDHEPAGLIYFRHRPDMVRDLADTVLVYGYHLYVSATAEPHYGYREIVRLLWQLYGHKHVTNVLPQVIPIDRYADYALDYATANLWRELPRAGEDEARGGFTMGIKFPDDIWFHFFFNHLHTAFGLHQMGERRGREDLIEKALKIRNLALDAPVKDGFPSAIFAHETITGIRRERWVSHAHWVGGAIPYQTQIARPPDLPAYSTMDGAWTCYWMLRWHTEIGPEPRLLERARAYAEQLLRIQRPSGSIPVFVDRETLEPMLHLAENPSGAAAGLFLAEMHEVSGEARYLEAARRVAAFLAREVMPQRWCDYESLYDSAGKPPDLLDRYSGQTSQNTFPIFWTAELAKLLYRQTGEAAYLEQARRALDYLLLFQAVWSPPYLTVHGFGSIGIGNGHTGWNDARSGIFAPGIADFYELTGDVEYLERGIAAMRAPLALMYIPENAKVSSVFDKGPLGFADECYAHRGRDARLGPSCFDFSVGYALVAFEELWPRYASLQVDAAAGRAVGIDGLRVTGLARSLHEGIDLEVADLAGAGREIVVAVRGSDVPVTVNGRHGRPLPAANDSARYAFNLNPR